MKVGFTASFYFAILAGFDVAVRAGAAAVFLTFLSVVLMRRVRIDLFDLGRGILTAVVIICVVASMRPFKVVYAAWYVILLVLLQIGCGSIRVQVRGSVRPTPLLDIVCAMHLVALASSSYLYFSAESLGLVNPNVGAALTGFLLLVYVLENHFRRRPTMIALCFLATLFQLSRSAVIWLVAAYFLQMALSGRTPGLFARLGRWAAVAALIGALTPLFVAEKIDADSINEMIVGMPAWLRLKDGGLDSDALRFVQYPLVLATQMEDKLDWLLGLGIGERPYLQQLADGEDLHNAFLVIISDGGLLLLGAVAFFALRPGRDAIALASTRMFIFFSGMVFAGVLLGLAPLTLSIVLLVVAARGVPASTDKRNRSAPRLLMLSPQPSGCLPPSQPHVLPGPLP